MVGKIFRILSVAALVFVTSTAIAKNERNGRCEDGFNLERYELELQVREEIEKVRHNHLPIRYNGLYYSLGQSEYKHERDTAALYATWLRRTANKKFLFMPNFGGVHTPGIDGTIFSDDATKPELRVSFKSIQKVKADVEVENKIAKVVQDATQGARRFSFLPNLVETMFSHHLDPRSREFNDRVKMLSTVGITEESSLPIAIVIAIDPFDETNLPAVNAEKLARILRRLRFKKPAEVIVLCKGEVIALKRGLDY